MDTQNKADTTPPPLPQPQSFPLYQGTDDNGDTWRRPYVDFKTTGNDSRTYRMFLVEPEVRIYDDPPRVDVSTMAVGIRTDQVIEVGSQIRGDILPARFDIQPHGEGPHISFKLSHIRPPIGDTTTPVHIGIEWIQVGRVGKVIDAMWSGLQARAVEQGLPIEAARQFGTVEVSHNDLRRIPLAQLVNKAMTMIGVHARVEKVYKRKPKENEYALPNGGSFRVTVIGFDNDQQAPKPTRGRKRGSTKSADATNRHPWHHISNLTIAAECKREGMTRAETAAHFKAVHGQVWSPDSIKKMWDKGREIELIKNTKRGNK
jgi:hypothetical protein